VFDHGYSTSEGRNGFGLHIVDRIAEAHGWTVEVTESESESETDGARFEFRSIDGAFDVEGDGDDDED
jgi:signal transduction histidine kinase